VAAAQWLAARLQLLAAVLVAAVALLAVLGHEGLLPWMSAHADRHGCMAHQRKLVYHTHFLTILRVAALSRCEQMLHADRHSRTACSCA